MIDSMVSNYYHSSLKLELIAHIQRSLANFLNKLPYYNRFLLADGSDISFCYFTQISVTLNFLTAVGSGQ